ncbi:MAG: hypothetical protein ACOX6S_10995 [Clostridia bacterium]
MLGWLAGHHYSSVRPTYHGGVMALMPTNMPWEARCQQTVE